MIIKKLNAQFEPFVADSWLRSGRKVPENKNADQITYNTSYGGLILTLMKKNTTLIMIDDEDQDHALGWISFSGDCMDYCYVKKQLRNSGYATALISASKCTKRSVSLKLGSKCKAINNLILDTWHVSNR